jgi:hypothetical protein
VDFAQRVFVSKSEYVQIEHHVKYVLRTNINLSLCLFKHDTVLTHWRVVVEFHSLISAVDRDGCSV